MSHLKHEKLSKIKGLRSCFDNIDKSRLMEQVATMISDGALLHLIRQFIDAGIMENNEIHQQDKGTPQGSPLSPFLPTSISIRWISSGSNPICLTDTAEMHILYVTLMTFSY